MKFRDDGEIKLIDRGDQVKASETSRLPSLAGALNDDACNPSQAKWLDKDTRSVEIRFIFYNGNLGSPACVHAKVTLAIM